MYGGIISQSPIILPACENSGTIEAIMQCQTISVPNSVVRKLYVKKPMLKLYWLSH